jgi:peptidoglycan/LPS O-acetylase OafA/YrhL
VRLAELDGIRGIAALFILIWHYVGIPMPPAGIYLQPDSWIPSFKLSLIFFRSGVDLFFVLSGFLIAGILLDHRKSQSYYRTFFIRRVCRIAPLYYTLVLIFAVAKITGANGPLFDGPIPLAGYITLTQNYFMAAWRNYGAIWLGATWSLAIEEQFYLSFPFIIRRAGAALPWILIAGIVGAPLLRIWCYHYFGNTDWGAYVWLPCRLDSLCWGALLAYILRKPTALSIICRRRQWIIGGFILLLAGAAVLDAALARDIGFHTSFWGNSLLAVLYTFAILLAVLYAGSSCTAFLRLDLLRRLGKISYGVYLVHGIALMSIFSIVGRPVGLKSLWDAGLIGIALMLTIVLCTISYHRLEAPFLRLAKLSMYS